MKLPGPSVMHLSIYATYNWNHMNITQAFILRLADMEENQCSNFLKLHKSEINFDMLIDKGNEMIQHAITCNDNETADKVSLVVGDAVLFAAVRRLPADAIIQTENL